ncbi:unnamed protein product [Timema podura]|uniref:Uncharacterized protein n=1 Tax=Timema podura TaxID=61482 RepID=A0ABN7NM71_TIMPD|nr:unnamed protein product [Timema podura]
MQKEIDGDEVWRENTARKLKKQMEGVYNNMTGRGPLCHVIGRGLSLTLFVLVMTLSVRAQRAWLFGCGLALFPLGVALAGCWSLIFSKILSSQLGLTPHSTSYDMWKETPVPMYMEFYLFNWTNGYIFNSSADKATLARTKPSFEQLGPYVFRY